MNIYVGNMSYDISDEDLKNLFASHGAVKSAVVIKDKMTSRSKGFGFVEMDNNDEAKAAIEQLDGHVVKERSLRVNEAKPREDKRDNFRRNAY